MLSSGVISINIDAKAVVVMTNKLEKMHRSALPVAVRETLNKAAFNTKTETLLKTTKKEFTTRQANFFKANSKVDKATGFNIKTMKSTIGMVSDRLVGSKNYAVEDLEEQEHGGTIKGKSFIPTSQARGQSGTQNTKAVRPNNRISKIRNIIKAKDAKGKNDGQKFIKSVYFAGKGGLVLAEHKGKEILWRVNSLNKNKKGGMKLTALYSYEKSRTVKVKGKGFMKESATESAKKLEQYFNEQAKKQIERLR